MIESDSSELLFEELSRKLGIWNVARYCWDLDFDQGELYKGGRCQFMEVRSKISLTWLVAFVDCELNDDLEGP